MSEMLITAIFLTFGQCIEEGTATQIIYTRCKITCRFMRDASFLPTLFSLHRPAGLAPMAQSGLGRRRSRIPPLFKIFKLTFEDLPVELLLRFLAALCPASRRHAQTLVYPGCFHARSCWSEGLLNAALNTTPESLPRQCRMPGWRAASPSSPHDSQFAHTLSFLPAWLGRCRPCAGGGGVLGGLGGCLASHKRLAPSLEPRQSGRSVLAARS